MALPRTGGGHGGPGVPAPPRWGAGRVVRPRGGPLPVAPPRDVANGLPVQSGVATATRGRALAAANRGLSRGPWGHRVVAVLAGAVLGRVAPPRRATIRCLGFPRVAG
eukprot:983611-Pyramimonas_sp.AAC.1